MRNTFNQKGLFFCCLFFGFVILFPSCGQAQNNTLRVPKKIQDSAITFVVDKDIVYTRVFQFKTEQGRLAFVKSVLLKQELDSLTKVTEQLREEYAKTNGEQKDVLANSILANEEKGLNLSQEITQLLNSAQGIEEKYWTTASSSEKDKLFKENQLVNDSLNNIKLEKQKAINETPPQLVAFSEPEKIKVNKEQPVEEGVIYKIQLGAFSKEPPEWFKRVYKKLSAIRKINMYSDSKGVKVYTVGELRSYQDALELQKQVKAEGIKEPAIAAYQNGKRIPLEEARKLTKEDVIKGENKKTTPTGGKKTK